MVPNCRFSLGHVPQGSETYLQSLLADYGRQWAGRPGVLDLIFRGGNTGNQATFFGAAEQLGQQGQGQFGGQGGQGGQGGWGQQGGQGGQGGWGQQGGQGGQGGWGGQGGQGGQGGWGQQGGQGGQGGWQ